MLSNSLLPSTSFFISFNAAIICFLSAIFSILPELNSGHKKLNDSPNLNFFDEASEQK